MITTKTTEEFDSDAVFNKLADCVNSEIHWNYKPDGYKEFSKWLNDEIEKFRQQAFSEGRKAGLKEMDEAQAAINFSDQCGKYPVSLLEAINAMVKLRQEYSAFPQ